MTCRDGERLVAFLAGDLSTREADAVDTHLLECYECWSAVSADTIGRTAAEALREVAPAGVRDRVRLSISVAPTRRLRRSWPRRTATSLTVIAVVCVALTAGVVVTSSRPNPDTLAVIVGRVSTATVTASAHRTGHASIRVAGRELRVEEYDLDGGRVLVAYDTQPFPMPADARAATPRINSPWSAPVDGWNVRCFNEPRPALLVSDRSVRAASIDALAHRLSLS